MRDMLNVMGGSVESDGFLYYKEQTIRAFLIARKYFPLLFAHARISESSGLRCFTGTSIENFEKRFFMGSDEISCAQTIDKITMNALDNHRTIIYDKIQFIQNQIH